MADPVLLFRYSALTFNGHRIHYDRDYVTKVEGYPGLIVPRPAAGGAAGRNGGASCTAARRRRNSCYRGLQPLFEGSEFSVNASATVSPAWNCGPRIRQGSPP